MVELYLDGDRIPNDLTPKTFEGTSKDSASSPTPSATASAPTGVSANVVEGRRGTDGGRLHNRV